MRRAIEGPSKNCAAEDAGRADSESDAVLQSRSQGPPLGQAEAKERPVSVNLAPSYILPAAQSEFG
jgi:hypothetical protein